MYSFLVDKTIPAVVAAVVTPTEIYVKKIEKNMFEPLWDDEMCGKLDANNQY